ncbi:MAG TPA: hypothetical protein DCX03_02090 [Bacteroidales bacterium]|nr:hypothetical protein [Bacteroidales bacterium]
MKNRTFMAFLLICLFALPLKSQNKTEALIDSLLDVYFEVSNSDRELALKLAERAQKLARENADKHNEAVALECLGVQYYYRGDYQKARNLLQQSLDIYHKENSSRGLASVFTNLGLVEQDLGNLSQAQFYYTTALVYDRNSQDTVGMAFTINNLGTLYLGMGNFQLARDYFQKSLAIGKSIHHPEVIANSINNLGLLHLESSNADSAIPYFRKALYIAEHEGYDYAQAIANINLCLCMIEKARADSAEKYLSKASQTAEYLQDKELLIECSLAKAKLLVLQGKPELANRVLFSAQKLNNQTERKKTSAQLYTLIGKNLLMMKQVEKARNYFMQSFHIAREIGALPEMMDAYKNLAMYYSTVAQYDSSDYYIKLYTNQSNHLAINMAASDTLPALFTSSNSGTPTHPTNKNSPLSPLKLVITLIIALTLFWTGIIYIPRFFLSLKKKKKGEDTSHISLK